MRTKGILTRRWGMKARIGASSLVLGLLASVGTQAAPPQFNDTGCVQAPSDYSPPPSWAPLIDVLQPTVVNIYTIQTVQAPTFGGNGWPFGQMFPGFPMPPGFSPGPQPDAPSAPAPREMERQSLGSGVILTSDGYIATNHHVIDHATEIRVSLFDGSEYIAEVVGSDVKTDLALLRVKADRELPHAAFGRSEELRIGDWVVAIGNPLGLQATVTTGIVSGKGRVIGAGPYDDFIQTDASINPGNSGGPLFDTAGRVVGISTAISRGAQGIGFAIPSDVAREVLSQLGSQGRVVRGWLGVAIQPVDRDMAEALDLEQARGVLVADVIDDSPASRAGFLSGDVIASCNGEQMMKPTDLTRLVASLSPGSALRCVVKRADGETTLTTNVTERQDEVSEAAPHGSGASERPEQPATDDVVRAAEARLGLTLDPSGGNKGEGVRVAGIAPGSPAAKAGLSRGDRILSVQRAQVDSPRAVVDAVQGVADGERILLQVQRGQTKRFTSLVLGSG